MADNVDGAERFTPITDPDVIGAALARIVKSPEFNDSKRSVQFLQYIVEKHQNGHASEINGTTIAQDVLGAGIDFDPSTNPIVRVQAGRLRKLLAEYYRRSGKDDNVLVYIAKGQYAPQFGVRNTAIEAKQTRNISPQALVKYSIASLASLVVLISIFYGMNLRLKNSPQPKTVEQIVEKYPSITILPFHNMTNNPENDVFEQGFQHQLGTDLSRFGIVRVVFADDRPKKNTPNDRTSADYVLEGTILSMANEIDLLIKLVNVKSGEITSQHRVTRKTEDESYYNALANISSIISDQYIGQEGALINDSLKNIKLDFDLENHRHSNLKAFECLSLFHKFETKKSEKNFNHAAGCLRYQVSQNPNDSSLLAALSWITVYGTSETGMTKDYPSKDHPLLVKALKLAEKAVTLDPGNSLAYEHIALIQWRMGSQQAAIQSIRRSIALNPGATGSLANLGHFLSFTGDWENGVNATTRAIVQNKNAPYWYFTPIFMRSVLDKNIENSVFYARKHNDVSGSDGGVYVLIAASMAGDQDTIDKYLPIIKRYAAKRGGDPLYVTRRWVQSPKIIEALEAELIAVGISVPKT